MKRLAIVLLPLLIITSCNYQKRRTSPEPINLSPYAHNLVEGSNNFGIELIKQVYDSTDIVFSPLSLYFAFGMVYNGADGNTAENIANALQFNYSLEQINEDFMTLIKQMPKVDNKVMLKIGNSVWINNKFDDVNKDYKKVVQKYFKAKVEQIPFNSQGVLKVNSWVSRRTNGFLKNVINELDGIMLVLNVLYFKAFWSEKFDVLPKKLDFYTDGEVKQLTAIGSEELEKVEYYVDSAITVVSIPYGKGNYSFLIFMPSSGNIDSFVQAFNYSEFEKYISQLQSNQPVNLKMPKFEIEKTFDLKQVLSKMGIKIFAEDKPNFSKISSSNEIAVSKVFQSARIIVDEKGTEAAAATGFVFMVTANYEIPIEITIDKPFWFAIRETTTGFILFNGVYKAKQTK